MRKLVRLCPAVVLLATALPGCRKAATGPVAAPARPAPAAPVEAGLLQGLTAAERRAIAKFQAANPDLRMATDADAKTSDQYDEVAQLYGIYHPYFVRGDVDDDGRLDFLAAFVDRKSPSGSPWFSVAIFRGGAGGEFQPPEFLEKEISLQDGDLSIDRDSILITPDISQDANRRYHWNAGHQRFEFVTDAGEPGPDRPTSRV
jgi:hypothetical protein